MTPPGTYTATCWRDGPSWTVHVPALGRTARARDLTEVEEVARGLVAAVDRGAGPCRVAVELVVRNGPGELLAAAAAARTDRDRVSVEAVTLRRCLARRLFAEGFDLPDVAALLGLSYGRAVQLVADGGHGGAHAGGASSGGSWSRNPAELPAPRGSLDDLDTGLSAVGAVGGVRPHTSYRHEAFLYRGEADFLAGSVPFLAEGVALRQPAMVLLAPRRLKQLRRALGEAVAERVFWVDICEVGRNPARLLAARQQFAEEHAADGVPVRALGEPVRAGRRAAEVAESQLYEALLNLAVHPDVPPWLRCPYDVDALPADVVEEAQRSHPMLVEAGGYRGSTVYGGSEHAADLFQADLPDPQHAVVEELPFDGDGVERVRAAVLHRAAEADVAAARCGDLALAVSEAATNSVQHGGGRGCLRIWREDDALVCEVRGGGRIRDPLVGRTMPSLLGEGGRGLWLANQLNDLVQIRSTEDGVVVRVHSLLAA